MSVNNHNQSESSLETYFSGWQLVSLERMGSLQPPGVHLIKLFTVAVYKCSHEVRVIVPGNSFQLSLMFVRKAKRLL